MNKIILIISFLYSNICLCQTKVIKFEYINDLGITRLYDLIATDSMSIYKSINQSHATKDVTIFKDSLVFFKKGNIVFYQDSDFQNKYMVKDSITDMKWVINKKDKKDILSFECYQAKTNFRGRSYTGYYTNEIGMINKGPWKFFGLPGVVLELKSDDGLFSFKALSVMDSKLDVNNMLPDIEAINYISWMEFKNNYKSTIDRIIKNLTEDKIKNKEELGASFFKFNRIEVIYPEAQNGKGLNF